MIVLLASVAFGQHTKIFESDEDAAAWIRATRQMMRTTLPVIGPAELARLAPLLSGVDHVPVVIPSSKDPDDAALDARMERGAPCAIALAPVDEGWAGWVSGRCGLLFLGSWKVDRGRVIDDRGYPITTAQFAADAGDRSVVRTARRLDRRRGNALLGMAVGTGLLYAGSIGYTGAKHAEENTTGWAIAIASGAALTTTGVGLFAWVQSDKRSHPRNLGAFYTEEEIAERVKAHNSRLRMVWTISPRSTGVVGVF